MLTLGPFAFLAPWVLAALALIPAIWFLVRATPPAPRHVSFPAARLLRGLKRDEQTPARSPWWLLVFRALAAAVLILALAGPVHTPQTRVAEGGTLVLLVDDGWAAGPVWSEISATLKQLVDQARRDDRPVMLATTAPERDGQVPSPRLMSAEEAQSAVAALAPKPWPADRQRAIAALSEGAFPEGARIEWLSDGLATAADDTAALVAALDALPHSGEIRLRAPRRKSAGEAGTAHLLVPPDLRAEGFTLRARRAPAPMAEQIFVQGLGAYGEVLSRTLLSFAPDMATAEAEVTLPAELRNKLVRFEIAGETGAGATVLLDERWARRTVGLVRPANTADGPNLLEPLFYLETALAPYADTKLSGLNELLEDAPSVMVLADASLPGQEVARRIGAWVAGGGVLLRFSGPRTSDAEDDLLPVELRSGGRALGGVMSWSDAMALAPFDDTSPFYGLTAPDDVRVRRQVLAEPSLDLAGKTWARLEDGTPLVTAEARGRGWIILVHTTADPAWSDLALSGVFVNMLRRVLALGQGKPGEATAALAPLEVMDGFGRLTQGAAHATSIAPPFEDATVRPGQPPGYYGTPDYRRALNLGPAIGSLAPLEPREAGLTHAGYGGAHERDLKPLLLSFALVLLLIDTALGFYLRGLGPRLWSLGRPGRDSAALVLLPLILWAGMATPLPAADISAREAANTTRLAYIGTGDPALDQRTAAGLAGLTRALNARTATELAAPAALTLEDDLIFYPLLYWVVTAEMPALTTPQLNRIRQYLRTGGLILFDTREAAPDMAGGADRRVAERLRALLRRLDLPALVAIPDDHVLHRAFYILDDFPGRWAEGRIWVEGQGDAATDHVTSVVVGGHDWAAAWAISDTGRPLYPVVPGGERQREIAYRFGVNLMMHALTGNYKADQVHVRALLGRIGE
ncbi:MAG: DUF4159 domain-containing protein [Alphaproteobacteria bacterium]